MDDFLAPEIDAPPPLTRAQVEVELLRPLAKRWNSRIKKALDKRKPWEKRAAECKAFYRCAADPIWKGDSKLGIDPLCGEKSKEFRFVLGKAFEFVAVFGPSLFYTVPHRRVSPRKAPTKIAGLVQQMVQADPMYQQMQQQFQMQSQMAMQAGMQPPPPPPPHPAMQMVQADAMRFQTQAATAELMELWLNYTPSEQPGTLGAHGKMATVDSMITGRGVLFARPIRKPSGRLVTGLFREDPLRFVSDPDQNNYQEAGWVAIKRVAPYKAVEAKFGLPVGTLKKKVSRESSFGSSYEDGMSADDGCEDPSDKDLFAYWEIFSKRGVGLDSPEQQPKADDRLATTLDLAVGPYAYLAVAPGVDHPLNAHPDFIVGNGADMAPGTPESVGKLFAWPFECWRDDRFPCEVLDYYVDPDSPYPIAPLTPGMGYLKFLTYMMSRLASRIDKSARDFIAITASYFDEIKEDLLKGEDLSCLRVPSGVQGGVKGMVDFLTQPQVNMDAWQIMEMVAMEFAKATGLNDMAYGGNPGGTQSRTAADASIKREATNIRPQYMQQTVEEFMSRASGLEAQCARAFVKGDTIGEVFGQTAGFLWDRHVASVDMNAIAGEFDYRVDAGSMRRPNKEQLIANLNQIAPVLLPFFQGLAQAGNVAPFNAMLSMLGDSIDQDMNGLLLQPPPPMPEMQPPPEEQAPPQEQAA